MKYKILMVLILVVYAGLTTSCSRIFMPYKETYSCRKGVDVGLCGSVSNIYYIYEKGYTLEEIKESLEKKKVNQKEKEKDVEKVIKDFYGGLE